MQLYLFTEKFPYGKHETFLENELPFLSEKFEQIIIIPLYKQNDLRKTPHNVDIWQEILVFNPKNKKKLLLDGIFNFSPFLFTIKEFFNKKVYSDKNRIWLFFTSLLMFRAIFANKKLWQRLFNEIKEEDKLYFYWGDNSALIIPFLKKNIKNTIFVRFHRSDLYEKAKGYIPFRKYLLPEIDWLIPISENGKDYLMDNYFYVDSKKIFVSRLGVFDNGLNANKKDGEVFHLLSCSNMSPVKRIHLIIEALSFVDFEIKWTHIGTGQLYDEIINTVKLLPANVHVNLLGLLSNREVLDYYRHNHVDLFINVSESEGVPVSIMEALSFGVPTVATNVGGTGEIVDNNVGKLLDVNVSAQEIADTIKLFANTDSLQFRKNARNRWNERCNAEKNYGEFTEFLCNKCSANTKTLQGRRLGAGGGTLSVIRTTNGQFHTKCH